MLSERINKIEKARRYVEETDRFTIAGDRAVVRGDHGSYTLSRQHDHWECDCDYCRRNGWCAHTLAVEWLLEERPHLSAN